MGCVQSYFRKAHSAGLSPSSTQASENAGLVPDTPTDPVKQIAEEAVITTQDAIREISLDTNGAPKTGIGLGPGVAALAASTGTVAILGATADTKLEAVEDVKQVAEEVVKDVKEAAEEAVKDVKTVAADVGKVAEDLGERVDDVITSPSQSDKQTPELKEAQSVTSSPIQEDNIESKEINKDVSLPTSPLPEDIKSDGKKDTSLPTSPAAEDYVPPVESKETSVLSSPVPNINKETGENKDEASLSLSSLPEDSIPSSIKEDVILTSSPSVFEENQESLAKSDTPNLKSPSEDLETNNAVQIVTEIEDKAASRPTSGVKASLADKTELDIVDDAFPDPPPPETQEATLLNNKKEETEDTADRNKRSIEETIENLKQQTPGLLEDDNRPVSVVELERKIEEVKATTETGVELSQISSSVEKIQEAAAPARFDVAGVEATVDKASSVESQNPQIEVSAPSRPQSSDVEFVVVTSPEVEVKQDVHENTEHVENQDEAEPNEAEKHEVPSNDATEEDIPVRPTSAQVEEKAEEVVNEVVQTVTEMVTTAATTIQATFRGHQTRQNLRKIADQEELTDAMSSELDKDVDVTLSLDAKSSDTKEELSETAEDSFPPPLNDGDSELLSTSTEKEELQPVVNVTINTEAVESLPESLVESEKVSEEKSLPSESEHGSLEGLLEDIPRAASVVSESTVSVGDSISAVKGSETDSTLSANEELGGDCEEKKGAAATTIQASFRGFQTRQNLQKIVDDTQLPVPEPLQDLPFEDVADEDDLPPPPEECDIEPPLPADVVVETPRSPETGEKLKKPAAQGEMEEAATKIQSNFRGYRTRQRLHRENAVQVTTSSGTPGTTSECSEAPPLPPPSAIRSSGEFHDMMVLPPDPPAADVTSDSWAGVGVSVGVDDDAVARRQASDLGTRLEGHVIAVATPATSAVSAMGKARETTSPKESSVKEMKGASVAKAAATKIQAGFRGYKVRKQMKQMKEKKNGPRRRSSVQPTQIVREKMTLQEKSATTIQAGVRGFLVRKRRLEEKNAAVKIQAGFRGYKVRRDVKTRAPVEK